MRVIFHGALLLGFAVLSMGCGQAFNQSSVRQSRFLASPVMGSSLLPSASLNGSASTTSGSIGSGTLGSGGVVTDEETCISCGDPLITPTPTPASKETLPFTRVCSTELSQTYGNVKTLSPLELTVYDQTNSTRLCRSVDLSMRNALLNDNAVPLPSDCNLSDGSYFVRVTRLGSNNSILSSYVSHSDFNVFGVQIRITQGKLSVDNGGNSQKSARLLFDAKAVGGSGINLDCNEYIEAPVTPYPEQPPYTEMPYPSDGGGGDGGSGGGGGGGGACPIVLNLDPSQTEVRRVPLTSAAAGVWFDLLGKNALPLPFTKKLTAWLQDYSFAWLVKPNRDGQVLGIDQLFGNNTELPDGSFEPHGYAALQRYDGRTTDLRQTGRRPDGLIDRNDDIYKELRVWVDHDLNGVASQNELFRLDQVGIEAMDLNYDSRYVERDAHGNRTTMRSIMKMRDGSLRMMFDLWLQYVP